MKKNVVKGILIVLLILIICYIISVIYKFTRLSAIQIALNNFNNSDNKTFSVNRNGTDVAFYYKDGNSKYCFIDNNKCVSEVYYIDGKKYEKALNEDSFREESDKVYNTQNSKLYLGESLWLANYETYDNSEILKLSLNPFNILSKKDINGQKYYQIQYSSNEIIYFDAKTLLPIISIYKTENGSIETNIFNAQNGSVEDKDVNLP